MEITILTAGDLALIPVVVGLVSIVKVFVVEKYAPLASIILGVAGSFVFPATTVGLTILAGIVVGLSASGLYSGTKATMQG